MCMCQCVCVSVCQDGEHLYVTVRGGYEGGGAPAEVLLGRHGSLVQEQRDAVCVAVVSGEVEGRLGVRVLQLGMRNRLL